MPLGIEITQLNIIKKQLKFLLTKTKSNPKQRAPVDKETEAKVDALVDAHLSELKGLLKRLRNAQPQEYDRAIRDLAKSAKRLEVAKNRDERLYDIEVELLQARTQANLLTAKLKVRDNARDRKALRQAAQRLQRAEMDRADYDVQQSQARLERVKNQHDAAVKRLSAKKDDPDAQLLKSYNAMLRKAGRKPKDSED